MNRINGSFRSPAGRLASIQYDSTNRRFRDKAAQFFKRLVRIRRVVEKPQREDDVVFAVLLGPDVEHVDLMVFDIAHAADVLGEAESRIVLVPEVEGDHTGAAPSCFEAEEAVRCADARQGRPSKILGELQLVPQVNRVIRAMGPYTGYDFKIVVPWPALNQSQRNCSVDHRRYIWFCSVRTNSAP